VSALRKVIDVFDQQSDSQALSPQAADMRGKLVGLRSMIISSSLGEIITLEGLGALIFILHPPFVSSVLFVFMHILISGSLLYFVRLVRTNTQTVLGSENADHIELGGNLYAVITSESIPVRETDTLLVKLFGPAFARWVFSMLHLFDAIRISKVMLTFGNGILVVCLVLIMAGVLPKSLSYIFAVAATLPFAMFTCFSMPVFSLVVRTPQCVSMILVLV